MVFVVIFLYVTITWPISKIEKMRIVDSGYGQQDSGNFLLLEDKKVKPQEKEIYAIYLTAYSAGSTKKVDQIIDSIRETKINAVVIDIKDYSGYLSYDSSIPLVNDLDLEEVKNWNNFAGTVKKIT